MSILTKGLLCGYDEAAYRLEIEADEVHLATPSICNINKYRWPLQRIKMLGHTKITLGGLLPGILMRAYGGIIAQ